jgi:guanylate kinase
MSSRKKRIVLVGKAASGKDHARKLLEKFEYPYQVAYTTRPIRIGEIDGMDYNFLSQSDFENLISQDFFYEWTVFNSWYYGTSKYQMERENVVFIMTPSGLSKMKYADRRDSFVVYFDIPEDIRRNRLSLRSDADSVERRILADELDFNGFLNYDVIINNPNFS